jgi:hypothetical protein
MKLPRWLVFAMLFSSLLSVLAAAGWWWVTWPERTAREFVDRLAAGDDDEESWKDMMPKDERTRRCQSVISRFSRPRGWWDVKPQPRTLRELCVGQHRFLIPGDRGWEFTAERGTVLCPPDRTLLLLETKWIDAEARKLIELRQRERKETLRQSSEKQSNP